jgi:ADP-ribose pyrophosphatase YjhB (NUDIX family)
MCAVVDGRGRLLLSRRGDLNVWALPGGRLDAGERLDSAAAREVREETGVSPRIEYPVLLVYLAGWRRVNVVFRAHPSGGELLDRSAEARANHFFSADALPQMPSASVVRAALAGAALESNCLVVSVKRWAAVWLRLRLGWRWVLNRLRGQPEPGFPPFSIRAIAVLWDQRGQRVLTLPGPGYQPADSASASRMLPRVVCSGDAAPWDALAGDLERRIGVRPTLRWVGIWHDVERGRLEFVFAAALWVSDLPVAAEWSTARSVALSDRDRAYVTHVKPDVRADPVWLLARDIQERSLIVKESGR